MEGHCPGNLSSCLQIGTPSEMFGLSLQVLPLSPEEIQDQLKLATEEMLARPAAAVQALLDHWHGSYAQELENAAQDILRASSSAS